MHSSLKVYDTTPAQSLVIYWILQHEESESILYLCCIQPYKGKNSLITLLPLIIASVSQCEGEKICIFNTKWAELLLHRLTTNQFHYSVFCLELEDTLDKMNKINRACESGCQCSPTDGHFTNRSEHEFVWQLRLYPLLNSLGKLKNLSFVVKSVFLCVHTC